MIFFVVILEMARKQQLALQGKYIVVFIAFFVHIVISAVVNSQDPGVFFSGLRNYYKFAPLFLVSVVFIMEDKDIVNQLKVLLLLGLFQLPVVIAQKFVFDQSADRIEGTLAISSVLSMYLVSCISVLLGFYFRKMISLSHLVIIVFLLFIPSTLNETKGTFLLLPLAVLTTMFVSGIWKGRMLASIGVVFGVAVLLTFSGAVYQHFFKVAGDDGVLAFFTDTDGGGVTDYLYTGDAEEIDPSRVLDYESSVIGAKGEIDSSQIRVRRIDNLILPLSVLSEDPVKLLVGLGIGNVTSSFLPALSGKYVYLGRLNDAYPALGIFLWELGLIGTLLFVCFLVMIFFDAVKLSRSKGVPAMLATGWTGVVVLIIFSLPYKNFLAFYVLGYLFFYFSGYIAAKRYQQMKGIN